jgi:UDP-N-acetylglucosamine--N-acetylmuramyl-(pentapeptide) pyrophosphoryl-undecaprenol N-acetylglucosamine transferase
MVFSNLITDENLQKQLSESIKKLAKVSATKDIINEIEKLIK